MEQNYQPIVISFIGISLLYSLLLASLYCTLFYWHLCIILSRGQFFHQISQGRTCLRAGLVSGPDLS
jgi:hypothetical protein